MLETPVRAASTSRAGRESRRLISVMAIPNPRQQNCTSDKHQIVLAKLSFILSHGYVNYF